MAEDKKVNQLEDYLRSLILDELRKREIEVSEADAQKIVFHLVKEIDNLTSKRVKQHFIELANFILEKFGGEE